MPLAILAYPRSFAVLTATQKADYISELLERVFLAVWDYDSTVYQMAVSIKAKQAAELIPPPTKPTSPDQLVPVAIIEASESVKSSRQRNVLVRTVKAYLKKHDVGLPDDSVMRLLDGVLDRLVGAGLIRVGTRRRKGSQEINYVKTASWKREEAMRALGLLQ